MSLDILQQTVGATIVRPPTSGTSNLGRGLQVDDNGFVTIRSFPADGTAATTVASSGTIAALGGVQRLTTGGAVTGVILTAGTFSGQMVHLINTSANSITFAAAGTSNVANGTSAVIAANTRMSLVWDAGSARWYHGN